MSLATSSPSSQTNTIPPPPSSTSASSLSPSSVFYHHRRIRQQQQQQQQHQSQHQQHFSTLVTAGLGQPQPVSAPLPTSLPTQLFNCTFNKNSDDNNNQNSNNNKMIDNHQDSNVQNFNLADNEDGQPKYSTSENGETRTAKIKQEEEKEADKTNNNINDNNRLKKEDDKTSYCEDSFHNNNNSVNEFKNETPISESPKTIVRRWSENFHSLIMNGGLDLFKEYMVEVRLSHMLDFYFACKGLKQSHPEKRLVILKAIIRRFILNPNQLSLSNQCRHKLLEAYRQEMAAKASRQQSKNNDNNHNNNNNNTEINNDDQPVYLDENTLNEAYLEIENQLKDAIYHNFLKSQIYLNYVNDLMKMSINHVHDVCGNEGGQTVQESAEVDDRQPKNSNDQPGPESMLPAAAAEDEPFEMEFNPFQMPTIVETSEDGDHSTMIPPMKISQQQQQPPPPPLMPRPPLSSRVFPPMANKSSLQSSSSSSSSSCRGEWPTFKLYTLDPNDSNKNNRTYGLEQQPPSGPPNPYHVNAHVQYSTVQYNSKKDSEIESISSSDSSFVSKYNDKKSSSLRNNSNNNNGRINLISNNSGGRSMMLHRSQRTSQQQQVKNRLIASENPDEFARRLIEKLNQVKKDQIIGQRLLKMLEQAEQERIQGSTHGGGGGGGAGQQQQQREAGVGQYSQSSSSNNNNMCTMAKSTGPTKSGLGQALKKFDFSVLGDPGESGQSILDEHFSKVFETPNADSPVATLSNQCDHIHYLGGTMMDGVGSGGGGGMGVGGGGSSSLTMMHTLPPPSPLSPSRQFLAQFGTQSVQSVTATISIPVYAKFSTEEMPHKLTMLGPHITLFQFKQQIPRKPGLQQFYFKRPCTELERQEINANFVLDQIKDDSTILPLCDGKIHALIEINES